MSARMTAAAVQVSLNEVTATGARRVMALVQGRNRIYVVDHNQHWSNDWLCTCGGAPTCPHIRATKEAIR